MSNYRDRNFSNYTEPNILGYQLIGDSQFLRFSEQLLRKQRKKNNGIAYFGLCVSGQKIGDLLKRVRENFYPTSKKAVLMIGTNDLLQNTNINTMKNNLDSLIDELLTRGVTKLILLTIPPVPRLAKSYDHWYRLKEFNNHIKTRHDGEDIIVINAYSRFVRSNIRDYHSSTSSSSLNTSNIKQRSSSSSILFPDELLNRTESPKYKLNLRISIGSKRKVYELSDGDLSLNQSSGSDYLSPSPAKRRFHNISTNEDDHNDKFVEEDSLQLISDIADDIRMDLFEEYFSRSNGRKDLIHFNYDGLKMIRTLILNEIEK